MFIAVSEANIVVLLLALFMMLASFVGLDEAKILVADAGKLCDESFSVVVAAWEDGFVFDFELIKSVISSRDLMVDGDSRSFFEKVDGDSNAADNVIMPIKPDAMVVAKLLVVEFAVFAAFDKYNVADVV